MTNLKTVQATLKGVNIDSFIVTGISKDSAVAFEKGQDFNSVEWSKTIRDHYIAGVDFFTNESKNKVYGLRNGFIFEISPYSVSLGIDEYFAVGIEDNSMLIARKA